MSKAFTWKALKGKLIYFLITFEKFSFFIPHPKKWFNWKKESFPSFSVLECFPPIELRKKWKARVYRRKYFWLSMDGKTPQLKIKMFMSWNSQLIGKVLIRQMECSGLFERHKKGRRFFAEKTTLKASKIEIN